VKSKSFSRCLVTSIVFLCNLISSSAFAELSDIIEKIKPSIVAIGTYQKTQSPPFLFRGTGFSFGSGNHIATNAHVLPEVALPDGPEIAILLAKRNGENELRRAKVVAKDPAHDLAILRVDGQPLPALQVGDSGSVHEGQDIAFTGFPIGGALGFSPVTHRGIISAITPIALPGGNASQLSARLISQLKQQKFNVLQLDATAYPGNSGSPVFDPVNGRVIGVINMVFVKGSKEAALSAPSGITYAIPVHFLLQLMNQ